MTRPAVALTIAGSDSGGGAGIEADLKTFAALGVWGTVALTAVTAQDTSRVSASLSIPARLVRAQVDAVVGDLGPSAAKTGMLGSADVAGAVAGAVEAHRITTVVDPVLVSTAGDPLLGAGGLEAMRDLLLPLAAVVTPNLPEAEALLGGEIRTRDDMAEAAAAIAALGPAAVLVKGGHLAGAAAPDVLWHAGRLNWLEAERLPGGPVHGTGCVLSAAICAHLALGASLEEAVAGAKHFVTAAIRAALRLGRGSLVANPGGRSG